MGLSNSDRAADPRLDLLLRALVDPTRRAIFVRLCREPATIAQIRADLPISQPAVSQHLSALRRAKLVTHERGRRVRVYRGQPAGLQPLKEWIMYEQARTRVFRI